MLRELRIRPPWGALHGVANQQGVDFDELWITLWGLAIHLRTGDTDPRLELRRSGRPVEAISVHVVDDATIWQLVRGLSVATAGPPAELRLVLGEGPCAEPPVPPEVVASSTSIDRGDVVYRWDDERTARSEGQALCRIFARLCAWLTGNPDGTVASIELLDPEEARRAVVSGPCVAFDESTTLHAKMFATAAAHPDRIAVRAADGALTYAELAARTRAVAQRLRAAGVGRGDRVGIVARRGLPLPIGLFGIMTAGAAYVPLDPTYPAARLRDMIRIARVSAVLSSVPVPGLETPIIDVGELEGGGAHALEPLDEGRSEDLCYIIFTSGSTGLPKGVMVSHRSVINRLSWMQARYPLGAEDVVLQKTPEIFDVSVWELFWWSHVGASMYSMPPGHERFPLAIAEAVARSRATVMHFIPSVLDPFLIHLERQGGQQRIASVRRVFCSGEALSSATVRRFWRVLGSNGTGLTNLYGPTEATVDVTYYDCPPHGQPLPRIPIGRPIHNTRLHVLRHGHPVPVGAAGTLFVAGACLARGYASAPEQTAAVFIQEPGSDELMYDTGDLVRWNDDGQLEFLGRCDAQVKISGMRVEPEEIEQVGREHPVVDDCAIAISGCGSSLVRLSAIVVTQASITGAELRAHFASRLPPHMVPMQCLRVHALPRTPSGKLDRRRLADPVFLKDHATPM
ncbi:amino acid adenylation domain-containing protein [Paraliomyxa miuraensis]|uniref:amino acid adenylation domain-containing protein n=1 Tax=Paraliomyxa miuraensis TaxID=376150 RepID=UPI00224E196E|nr:amino acid adenylation domain-containing protein [Paraliomyxa miuraensis]MCX4243032.1 amino acid adenylation domain-containing protein [Paraliomyxa miuraensis]